MIALLLAAVLVLVTACTGGGAEVGKSDDDKGTVTIGLNNWPENIAVSHMWKILLEEQGYTVELKSMEKGPLWVGVANGDLDLSPEVWLPTTDAPLYEENKDNLELHEAWYEGTGLGLVVPTYMDVTNIDELETKKADFGIDSIVGIDPGSSLMRLTRDAIEDYGMSYKLIESSDPAMMSALDKAYKTEEPIVVTLWSPHWAFSRYDLKYLEDPKNIYGAPEDIKYMTRKGFKEEFPEIITWMNNWQMDDASLGALMATINDSSKPEEGVAKWLKDNRELVDGWVKK